MLRELVAGRAPWPLFLHGPPGTGKTCAALALADHLREWECRYVTAADLTARVMATFGTRDAYDWTPFGRFRDAGVNPDAPSGKTGALLVVLDELGTREVKDTHYECVQRVIDLREGLPLILVSNHDADRIARVYDERIASRCQAGTVVELAGRDRRVT